MSCGDAYGLGLRAQGLGVSEWRREEKSGGRTIGWIVARMQQGQRDGSFPTRWMCAVAGYGVAEIMTMVAAATTAMNVNVLASRKKTHLSFAVKIRHAVHSVPLAGLFPLSRAMLSEPAIAFEETGSAHDAYHALGRILCLCVEPADVPASRALIAEYLSAAPAVVAGPHAELVAAVQGGALRMV